MSVTETPACRVRRLDISGHSAVRLENGIVQADVIPGLGAKIWNLSHVPSGTQWIWHNPNRPLHAVKPEDGYDDQWAGGWEELFPNDAKGAFQGRMLPDHGEWWSREWTAEFSESAGSRAAVRLGLEGRALKARCEKRIELAAGSSELQVHYRIENLEPEAIYFMFKQHLAVAVTPAHRLELPGGWVTPVDAKFSTRLGSGDRFRWPQGKDASGRSVDLSLLPPPEQRQREFVYVEELPEGWCGVRDESTGRSLRLEFSRDVFPYTWLFATYGGWRDLYTVVLEPCTTMPKDLNEARRLGRCARLGPGEVLETTVRAALS